MIATPAKLAAVALGSFRFFARDNDDWLRGFYLAQILPLREWPIWGLKTASAMEVMARRDWIQLAEQAGQLLVKQGVLARSRSKRTEGYRLRRKWWNTIAKGGGHDPAKDSKVGRGPSVGQDDLPDRFAVL